MHTPCSRYIQQFRSICIEGTYSCPTTVIFEFSYTQFVKPEFTTQSVIARYVLNTYHHSAYATQWRISLYHIAVLASVVRGIFAHYIVIGIVISYPIEGLVSDAYRFELGKHFHRYRELVFFRPYSVLWRATRLGNLQRYFYLIVVIAKVGTEPYKGDSLIVVQRLILISFGVYKHLDILILPQVKAQRLIHRSTIFIFEIIYYVR